MAIYNIVQNYKRPQGYDTLLQLSSHNVVPCQWTMNETTINATPIIPQKAWDMSFGVTIGLFGYSGSMANAPTSIVIYGVIYNIDASSIPLIQRTINRGGAAIIYIFKNDNGAFAFFYNTDSQTSLRADEASKVNVAGIEGVLPPNKGGTGTTSIDSLRQQMGLGTVGSILTIAQGGTGANSAAGAKNTLGFATRAEYTGTLTTHWKGGNPYLQNVAIAGITANDTPIIAPTLTSVLATDTPRIQGWGNVWRSYTYNGGITFVCYNIITSVNIPFRCLVVR